MPIYAILVRSVLHIYAVGLYIYTLPPFAVTLFPTRVPHPLSGVSTTYSRVSEETPPTVCTRLAACVHTPFRFSVFRPLYIVYIYKKVPVTERCLLMKQRGNRNVGFITVGCKIVSGFRFQVPGSKFKAIAISHRYCLQPSLSPSAMQAVVFPLLLFTLAFTFTLQCNYSVILFYFKRRDAEAQRILPFDRKCPEYAESWPTSQPMAHLKTLAKRFTLQVSIKL